MTQSTAIATAVSVVSWTLAARGFRWLLVGWLTLLHYPPAGGSTADEPESPWWVRRSQASSTGSSRTSAHAASWSWWWGERGSPEAPSGTTHPLLARSSRSQT